MREHEQSGITISNHSGGDWKVAIVGGGFVVLGVGFAVMAAEFGLAVIILAAGGSLGLAAWGIGRGLEHARRGSSYEKAAEALIEAARRGALTDPVGISRALILPEGSPRGRGSGRNRLNSL